MVKGNENQKINKNVFIVFVYCDLRTLTTRGMEFRNDALRDGQLTARDEALLHFGFLDSEWKFG